MIVNDNNVASGRLRITVAENPQTDGWWLLWGPAADHRCLTDARRSIAPAIESPLRGLSACHPGCTWSRVPIGQNVKSRAAFRLVSATDLQGSHVDRQMRPTHLVGPSRAKATPAIGTLLSYAPLPQKKRVSGLARFQQPYPRQRDLPALRGLAGFAAPAFIGDSQ